MHIAVSVEWLMWLVNCQVVNSDIDQYQYQSHVLECGKKCLHGWHAAGDNVTSLQAISASAWGQI